MVTDMNRFERMGAVFFFEINGFKIFAVNDLLIQEKQSIKRTFVERFFSFPWRPWVSHYEVTVVREDEGVYLVTENDEKKLYAHPSKVRQIALDIIAKINKETAIDSE